MKFRNIIHDCAFTIGSYHENNKGCESTLQNLVNEWDYTKIGCANK